MVAIAAVRSKFMGPLFTALLLLTGFVPPVGAEGSARLASIRLAGRALAAVHPFSRVANPLVSLVSLDIGSRHGGAISMAPNGASGTSAGKLSKSDAGKKP